jgi:hypothetical protein
MGRQYESKFDDLDLPDDARQKSRYCDWNARPDEATTERREHDARLDFKPIERALKPKRRR